MQSEYGQVLHSVATPFSRVLLSGGLKAAFVMSARTRKNPRVGSDEIIVTMSNIPTQIERWKVLIMLVNYMKDYLPSVHLMSCWN